MRLARIAFTMVALSIIYSVAVASGDPITVNVTPKKHTSNSAAIEVTVCIPSSSIICTYDAESAFTSMMDKHYGIHVLSVVASHTLDDAITSARHMPNVLLRDSGRTTNVVVVWDRRL
jgi:hypothetical protein